jgi:hypothetical protein
MNSVRAIVPLRPLTRRLRAGATLFRPSGTPRWRRLGRLTYFFKRRIGQVYFAPLEFQRSALDGWFYDRRRSQIDKLFLARNLFGFPFAKISSDQKAKKGSKSKARLRTLLHKASLALPYVQVCPFYYFPLALG